VVLTLSLCFTSVCVDRRCARNVSSDVEISFGDAQVCLGSIEDVQGTCQAMLKSHLGDAQVCFASIDAEGESKPKKKIVVVI
jgi:hypothetical protein